jgi:hypothetical protein
MAQHSAADYSLLSPVAAVLALSGLALSSRLRSLGAGQTCRSAISGSGHYRSWRVEIEPLESGLRLMRTWRSSLTACLSCHCEFIAVKVAQYFDAIRIRPDRAVIEDAWIERAVREPIREAVQTDGRIRRWAQIPEADGRYLRVVLLEDGETVHNAFFDRRFAP